MTKALAVDSYLAGDAESVVARVRMGDPAALEILYRAYETPVFNLARRICRTVEDAEDVLQETFFEVYPQHRAVPGRWTALGLGPARGVEQGADAAAEEQVPGDRRVVR